MSAAALVSCTVTELSLSVDNVMVWSLILDRLDIPARRRRAVVAAGVGIALVLRVVAIAAGAVALESLAWLTYALGAVLVWTGYRIARSGEDSGEDGRIIRVASRLLRSRVAVAVAALGVTDLVFAVDSVPASFAITRDAATIAVANGVALAALWSLYGVVAALAARFRFLSHGLAVVMVWLGGTMLAAELVSVPHWLTLVVITAALSVSAAVSALVARPAVSVTK